MQSHLAKLHHTSSSIETEENEETLPCIRNTVTDHANESSVDLTNETFSVVQSPTTNVSNKSRVDDIQNLSIPVAQTERVTERPQRKRTTVRREIGTTKKMKK